MCGDRNETVNYKTSECSKLAQKKFKTKYDWLENVIHWELCKILKFNPTKPESIQENERYKILWDFEILTDHLIPVRRPEQVFINKVTKLAILWMLLFRQTTEWKKKERKKEKKINIFLDLARKLKISM